MVAPRKEGNAKSSMKKHEKSQSGESVQIACLCGLELSKGLSPNRQKRGEGPQIVGTSSRIAGRRNVGEEFLTVPG